MSYASRTEKMRLQIHYSMLDMLSICGVRFEFRYVKGIKKPPGTFMLAGTGTDRGVSANLQNKIETGNLLPLDAVTDIARQAVQDTANSEDIELDEEEKTIGKAQVISNTKDKAVRLVKVHHINVAPAILPTYVSRKFSINMDSYLRDRAKQLYGEAEISANSYSKKILKSQARALNALAKRGVDFCGEIDIQEAAIVRDTKTSTKSPSEDAADKSEQLSAYSLATHVLDGKLPDTVALDYLVDLKKEQKAVTRQSRRDMQAIEIFLRRITSAIHAIHTGVFTPAASGDWHCSEQWCGFWHSCDFVQKKRVTSVPDAAKLVQINF